MIQFIEKSNKEIVELYNKCSETINKNVPIVINHLYFSKIISNLIIEETGV